MQGGGDRRRQPSASGAPRGLRGSGGRKHPDPTNSTPSWWASSLSAGLAPSPKMVAAPGSKQIPLPQLRPLQGLLAI